MPKPIPRKERIKRKAQTRRIEIQSKKIRGLNNKVDDLEKRLKVIEKKGGGPS